MKNLVLDYCIVNFLVMVIMKRISFGMIKFQEQVKLIAHSVLWEQYLNFQRVYVLFGLCVQG